jgi:hypothetical protein
MGDTLGGRGRAERAASRCVSTDPARTVERPVSPLHLDRRPKLSHRRERSGVEGNHGLVLWRRALRRVLQRPSPAASREPRAAPELTSGVAAPPCRAKLHLRPALRTPRRPHLPTPLLRLQIQTEPPRSVNSRARGAARLLRAGRISASWKYDFTGSVAHCGGCSSSCSNTRRTARSQISCAYLVDVIKNLFRHIP